MQSCPSCLGGAGTAREWRKGGVGRGVPWMLAFCLALIGVPLVSQPSLEKPSLPSLAVHPLPRALFSSSPYVTSLWDHCRR